MTRSGVGALTGRFRDDRGRFRDDREPSGIVRGGQVQLETVRNGQGWSTRSSSEMPDHWLMV